MNYKFEIQKLDIDKYHYYFININEEHKIITRFSDSGWTSQKAQEIIDGVEKGKTKPKESAYEWANEDVYIISNQNGLFLIDLMAQRAGETDQDKLGLQLTHQEFIQFLQDFKKFIEQNS